MDTLKKYIDCYIPTETCNLRCHYCYIAQKRKFNSKIAKFQYSPSFIRQALSKKRLGGICLLNMCAGGETLLCDQIIDIIKELLLEGHYVMVVTNGLLTRQFDKIAQFPKIISKRLVFKFSFHYLELIRLNRIDEFFYNVQQMKACGCSYTVEITPSDELIPHINDVKKICLNKVGALCHVTIPRDDRTDNINLLSKYNMDEFYKIWGTFNSELLNFKHEIFYKKRTEFCYAGKWSFYLNLATGDVWQCYCGRHLDNIYMNINKAIHLVPIGARCTMPHCYNGHSFLALGDIPELDTPTYASLRNRICLDGTEWLQPEIKAIMSCKLKEQNREFSNAQKNLTNIQNFAYHVVHQIKDSFPKGSGKGE